MAPVTQLSDMPRYRLGKALATAPGREGSAEIHILPCIRREPLTVAEAMRRHVQQADASRSA